MLRLSSLPSLAVVAAITSSAGCIITSDDNEFTIWNDSDYVLTEVYLAEETDPSWGPNLLPEPLFPGDELIITDIDCGTYDALVVDETGVECELSGIDLCLGDTDGWVIDNFTLDVCAFGG